MMTKMIMMIMSEKSKINNSPVKILFKNFNEGRMEGKRPKGRPRMGMIDDIMMGSYEHMKRRALDREGWRVWVPRTCHAAEN